MNDTKPKRIQRTRTKGWRMPEGVLFVGRPTFWGNPFAVGKVAAHRHRATTAPYDFYADHHQIVSAEQAVSLYRKIICDPVEHQYLGHNTPTMHAIRMELAGKNLACWCPLDQPCHADVLLALANVATS